MPLGTPDPRSAIRCSGCAMLVAGGASFCSSCGTALAVATSEPSMLPCPACEDAQMRTFGLAPSPDKPGGLPVHGCTRCGGAWIDRSSLRTILEEAARHAPMAGHGTGSEGVQRRQLAAGSAGRRVEYRRCPACSQRMMRKNFARISGVIIDECGPHGSFFDAGELRDVLAFVQSGGLWLARRKEQDEHARLREASLRTAQLDAAGPTGGTAIPLGGLDAGADITSAFIGWARRWVRMMFS